MKFAHAAAATLAAFASIAATAAPAPGPDAPLIPRASIFGNPTRAQGLISPDGKWISWLAPRDGVLNIWVAPANDLAKATPLTSEKVRPIRQHFWTLDSKQILFINDHGGDENYLLYGVSPAGGEARSFTPFQKTAVQFIGDSRKHRDEVMIGLNNRDPQWHDAYVLNTSTGELKKVYENHGFSGFIADDDLAIRFATREIPGGTTEVLRFDDGKTEPFTTVPPEDSISSQTLGMSADGKTLYAIDSRGRDKAALVAMDAASGRQTVLGESTRADVVPAIMSNPRTLAPEAYSVNYLKSEWFPIGDAVKADIAALNGLVKGQWNVVSRDDADTHWVVFVDEVTKPVAYYLYDRAARKLDRLFVTRPDLEGKALAP
ncbi:MAG TPA: S9 family peptidase, partial [Usitatibacter sp.]|nr:S9 family peptidase [Usitatibacter sp.]